MQSARTPSLDTLLQWAHEQDSAEWAEQAEAQQAFHEALSREEWDEYMHSDAIAHEVLHGTPPQLPSGASFPRLPPDGSTPSEAHSGPGRTGG
eukprot:596681-Alexandrium_andersonii.AAC.1